NADCSRLYAAILRRRSVSRLLYRAAVFFLMMPHLAERSIKENVFGINAVAAFVSFALSRRRMARIWCRSRVLRVRFTAVRRSATRTRFSEEIVFAILSF